MSSLYKLISNDPNHIAQLKIANWDEPCIALSKEHFIEIFHHFQNSNENPNSDQFVFERLQSIISLMSSDSEKYFLKIKASFEDYTCIIEEDLPDIGYYLYVMKNGENIADHLQDTLELAKQEALEMYNIPLSAWELVNGNV